MYLGSVICLMLSIWTHRILRDGPEVDSFTQLQYTNNMPNNIIIIIALVKQLEWPGLKYYTHNLPDMAMYYIPFYNS